MATTRSIDAVPRMSTHALNMQRVRALKNFSAAMFFLLPSLAIFTFFVFIPLFKTIDLSRYLTDPIGRATVINFPENYERIFSEPDLENSLIVSLKFALFVVPTTIIVSLFLAVLANFQIKFVSIFRVIFSSTIAVSGATASLIFLFLYNPVNGVLNYVLELMHLPAVKWLVDENVAPPCHERQEHADRANWAFTFAGPGAAAIQHRDGRRRTDFDSNFCALYPGK